MEGQAEQVQPPTTTRSGVGRAGLLAFDLLAVLQAVPEVWKHLSSPDATSLRTVCRQTRGQHVAWCRALRIHGKSFLSAEDQNQSAPTLGGGKKGKKARTARSHSATQRITAGIEKLAGQGYRPQVIRVEPDHSFASGTTIRPLVQAFGPDLTTLELLVAPAANDSGSFSGEPTLRLPPQPADWAAQLVASLPSLTSLGLDLATRREEEAAAPLRRALGTRLRSLQLGCLWTRRLPAGLEACAPSLERLVLNSGPSGWYLDSYPDEEEEAREDGGVDPFEPGGAARCVGEIAALAPGLRSLELITFDSSRSAGIIDARRELAPLASALTALTRLVLNVPRAADEEEHRPSDYVTAFWYNSWRMSAVLAGRQVLTELDLPQSYIRAGDCVVLSALTGLRRLRCEGIGTPAVARQRCRRRRGAADAAAGGEGDGGHGMPLVPLPPNLQELEVISMLPTLHLAACLAALPSRPRLKLQLHSHENDCYSRLALLGGGRGAPWQQAAVGESCRYRR